MKPAFALLLVKLLHTVAWALFAGCILLLPVATFLGRFEMAAVLIALVAIEILVLALSGWRCPLTGIAARFTDDRRDNFDIFLPLLLARYNKQVSGALFVLGVLHTACSWWRR